MTTPRVTSPNAYLLEDSKWLKEHYVAKNLSLAKIAELIGCTKLTVKRRLVKFGIQIKPKHIVYGEVNLNPAKGEKNGNWKGGKHKCFDCNIELGYRYSGKNNPRCKPCAVKHYRGEKHHSWKPDEEKSVPLNNNIRHSADYRDWRNMVFMRDGYKCQICGINNNNLKAHHLDGFSIAPERRFDVTNGVTLCNEHHVQFHREYGFGGNTKVQFDEFSAKTEVTF